MTYGFPTSDFSTANEVSHMQRTLVLTPAKKHTSSHTLNSRQSENVQTRLCSLVPAPNIHIKEGVFKDWYIVTFPLLHISTRWPYSQSNLELDRAGETVCPVLCYPNPATLITVSPSDLTLGFLLQACWLAGGPGHQPPSCEAAGFLYDTFKKLKMTTGHGESLHLKREC